MKEIVKKKIKKFLAVKDTTGEMNFILLHKII
jgi:hypothetical protein